MTRRRGFIRTGPRGADDPVQGHYYEAASNDPSEPQVWCYTDRMSYAPGDTVRFFVSTSAHEFHLEISRDGARRERVFVREDLKGAFYDTPDDCSVSGCGWPVAFELVIPGDWPSGGYVVTSRITAPDGQDITQDHFFVLRALQGRPTAPLLLIACTSTWIAYNDWGGSNHYEGLVAQHGNGFSPLLSVERPWARGFIRLPPDAPRVPNASPPGGPPRYPHMEWAFTNGYSKKYASAGWASYERHLAVWAERRSLQLDYATQHDLHFRPDLLSHYPCVVIVGHDEYWSWEMRDAIDAYLDGGGHVARFAGNFVWQIRLQDQGHRQVCYKYHARAEDPLHASAKRHLTTTCWDAKVIGRPAATTMGLSGAAGIYAGWSRCVAHGSGGFTVYRPEHWAFDGTELGYGDVLGGRSRIFGYEVDGLEYMIRRGLPYPTHDDGAPEGIEILALSPATAIEHGFEDYAAESFIGDTDARFLAEALHGSVTPETIGRVSRGSGMIAEFRRGAGSVFNAGSCEWVAGLIADDHRVGRVTENVLRGFAKNNPLS